MENDRQNIGGIIQMESFAQMIQSNPYFLLYLFAGAVALILVIFIISKVVSANKKKKMRAGGDLAEIVFAGTALPASRVMMDTGVNGYKLFTVNGAEPKVIDKSIFVPVGPCVIDLEYLETIAVTNRRSTTTSYGRRTVQLEAKKGVQYKLGYNTKTNQYDLKETTNK
jgi:hypothetical protein